MKKPKKISFDYFRYQILPISQEFQPQLFDAYAKSKEELIQRKNEFFAKAISAPSDFNYARADIIRKLVYHDDNIFLLRLAVNRKLNRKKPDFTEEEIDNWPNIWIAINNDPQVQRIAVQVDRETFVKTTTIIGVLQENINRVISLYQLRVLINPLFEQNDFWALVDRYPKQIIRVTFDMISPNMSNISETLELDLRQIKERTNTQETLLELRSDEASSLTLSQNDTFVKSLVNYSSEGGGSISLKVRGIKKIFRTNDSIKEEYIDEITLKGEDPERLAKVFREIMR